MSLEHHLSYTMLLRSTVRVFCDLPSDINVRANEVVAEATALASTEILHRRQRKYELDESGVTYFLEDS